VTCGVQADRQAAGASHVSSAAEGRRLAPPGDQRSRLFLMVRQPMKLTNDALCGTMQFKIMHCNYDT